MILAFRKVLLAVALIAGLSASAVISLQVVDEVNHVYPHIES
jgi:hypothetical protein